MFTFKFIKNPRYFYTAIAATFGIFVLLIIFTGRQIYEGEKHKLYESKASELSITRINFEQRIDEVELELRRVVNAMKYQNLFERPEESLINAFVSDFLFDHHYISIIIRDSNNNFTKLDSPNTPEEYKDFLKLSGKEIFSILPLKDVNNIVISNELKLLYLVKYLPNSIGDEDKCIVFFFTPALLLKYLPSSYALLLKDENKQWTPASNNFPKNFDLPKVIEDSNFIPISDTQSVFVAPLQNNNTNYVLASVTDMSELRHTLLYSTIITVIFFSAFFIFIVVLIYIRNQQISQLIETQKATVVCLANLAEFKDNETADHLERTRHYGTLLSNYLKQKPEFNSKISREYIENIGFASVLHDIGKVGVPDSILKKPDKLTSDEFEVIKHHTTYAKNILKDLVSKYKINDIFFTLAYNIAVYHHEKWDGSGYPEGLSGIDIPLEARIFSACDVYDALCSERVYKPPFSHEKAMSIINEGKGTHFDPDVVDAINACAEQFKQIHNTYNLFYKNVKYSSYGNNRRELKVEWTEDLTTGIEEIDAQHKILLSRINTLIKSIMVGNGTEDVLNLLRFLENYVEEHFSTEEGIMHELNYENTEHHIKYHERFRNNFKSILENVSKNGITEETFVLIEKDIISWLLNHILEHDTKIMPQES